MQMINNFLENKKILVTGASSGIGRETAIFFSKQGAQLVITGRDESQLINTLNMLEGESHMFFVADLSRVDSISFLMDSIFNEIGELDGVVHCAGILKTLPLKAMQENYFDDVFNINVKSAQFLIKEFRKKGRHNHDKTSVVFLSSVAANRGEASVATYAASKAAIEGLSRSLAVELARQNIRVNCIAPGQVKTDMYLNTSNFFTKDQLQHVSQRHPLGLGLPEDIAHAAAFLISDYSRWVTGTVLTVDGGYSIN